MTKHEFQKLLREWCQNVNFAADKLSALKSDIEFLGSNLFNEYLPTKNGPEGDFSVRLAKWIGSAQTEADQQTMFILLRYLFFVGSEDLDAAYRTAYSKHVMEWLISKLGLNVLASDAETTLKEALGSTRYTAITDSFNLAKFVQMNNLHGHSVRYTWESQMVTNANGVPGWDSDAFRTTVMLHGTVHEKRYLVLMEDFVGSGSQARKALTLAQALPIQDLQILFCPLIICPEGARMARLLQSMHANFTFSPVLELGENGFISQHPLASENKDFDRIRQCLVRLYPSVTGPNRGPQDWGEFGFKNTGAIVVKYDNCPDNSLPLLHRSGYEHWKPLFRRTSREAL